MMELDPTNRRDWGFDQTGEDVGGFPQQCLSGLFLSFVRISYGKDSTHARPHDEKVPHEILQGER